MACFIRQLLHFAYCADLFAPHRKSSHAWGQVTCAPLGGGAQLEGRSRPCLSRREQQISLRHSSSSALSAAFGRCFSGSRLAAKFWTLALDEEDGSFDPWELLEALDRALADTNAGSSDQVASLLAMVLTKVGHLSSSNSCFCRRLLSSFPRYGRSSINSS